MSSAVGALRGLALQVELFCPENAAGHIATTEQCLQRLVLGGIKLAVVLQASTAAHAVKQQRLLANYNLPENTIVVTAQPRTLAVCLRQASTVDLPSLTLYFPGYLTSNKGICRSIAVKLGVEAPAVGFAAAETQDAAAACKCAGVQHLQLSHSHVTGSSHHWFQLLHHVAMSHTLHADALLVGYTMKPSRERNLASRGLLPLTAPHGVCFVPIDFSLPLEQQGPFDILLHKATDELVSRGAEELPQFSVRIAPLAAYIQAHPATVMVDSLDKLQQVINRQTLTRCLEEAASAARAQGHAVQAPPSIQACHTHLLSAIMRQSQLAQQGREIHSCHYILVDRLGPDAETRRLLAQHGIRLPCIVKPRVACGTPEAHQMAVVLHEDGFTDLQVVMPGCLQQFINHNGKLHKVYVMGDQMHVAERQSIPNLPAAHTGGAGLPHTIAFDSLKTLPQRDYLQPHYQSQQQPPGSGLKHGVVRAITKELRKILGLTLFGYDTVVQEGTGVHFIIDVNYFPSYKEFPDAARVLSSVLKKAHYAHTEPKQTVTADV
ncbi:hypothetical protein ABBQ38_002708 [Trebouxia sp. C0009 RCD-2024]